MLQPTTGTKNHYHPTVRKTKLIKKLPCNTLYKTMISSSVTEINMNQKG